MKIRNGFVSNSSSSSFIITIAKVTDEAKFLSMVRKEFLDVDLINGLTDYYENHISSWGNEFDCEWAGYFDGDETIISALKENPDQMICVKRGRGPDDDSFFQREDYWECDYDIIDLDDFDEIDQKFYNGEIEGLENIDSFYGAGRNG